jgi:hypothetical protein
MLRMMGMFQHPHLVIPCGINPLLALEYEPFIILPRITRSVVLRVVQPKSNTSMLLLVNAIMDTFMTCIREVQLGP